MKNFFLTHQLYLYGTYVILVYGCGPSEYQSGDGECCPMCNIGMVVHIDCHGDYSTACKPCTGGTFMDQPNGLKQCFHCKSCDSQQGLHVVNPCTTMMNTQCGVLHGYYCTDFRGSDCRSAQKHRQCAPGEAVKTPGSEKSDTVCEACPSGFYSPLGINCTRWTDCSVRNELKHREGSAVEDVQCQSRTRLRHGITAAVILSLAVLLYTVIWMSLDRRKENGGGGATGVELSLQ